jgi:hypothetical protein
MYEFMSVPYNVSAVTDDKRLLNFFFPETCPMGKSLKKIFRRCNIHRMENKGNNKITELRTILQRESQTHNYINRQISQQPENFLLSNMTKRLYIQHRDLSNAIHCKLLYYINSRFITHDNKLIILYPFQHGMNKA